MIEIDEKLVGVWFLPMREADWMGALRELEPEKKYELIMRLRHHKDQNHPFDTKDTKQWSRAEVTDCKAIAIAGIRILAQKLHADAGTEKPTELLMQNGDVNDFLRRMQDLPFVFMRPEKKK